MELIDGWKSLERVGKYNTEYNGYFIENKYVTDIKYAKFDNIIDRLRHLEVHNYDISNVINTLENKLNEELDSFIGQKVILKRGYYKGYHAIITRYMLFDFSGLNLRFFVDVLYKNEKDIISNAKTDTRRGYKLFELEFL
jgi:hypothetical protein